MRRLPHLSLTCSLYLLKRENKDLYLLKRENKERKRKIRERKSFVKISLKAGDIHPSLPQAVNVTLPSLY